MVSNSLPVFALPVVGLSLLTVGFINKSACLVQIWIIICYLVLLHNDNRTGQTDCQLEPVRIQNFPRFIAVVEA